MHGHTTEGIDWNDVKMIALRNRGRAKIYCTRCDSILFIFYDREGRRWFADPGHPERW